jgi:hypothetical protein
MDLTRLAASRHGEGTMRKRSEYEDLLIFYYFGADEDHLRACRRRAYLDFNRTLHGIRANEGAYANAEKVLAGCLATIRGMKDLTQGKFDGVAPKHECHLGGQLSPGCVLKIHGRAWAEMDQHDV